MPHSVRKTFYVFSLSTLLIFYSSISFAKVTGLIGWQENEVYLILPQLEGKDAAAIPQLYKTALEQSKPYKGFSPFFGKDGSIAEKFDPGKTFSPLSFKDLKESVPIALFANRPALMNSTHRNFLSFKKSFSAAGAFIYTIPLGIDALLTESEDLKTYFDLITKQFPALIAAGGADFDPSLYGEKNVSSINPNLTRDKTELLLIKGYLAADQGVFYGICRGHQGYAVATGGSLIQDLPVRLSPGVIHRPVKNPDGSLSGSWHPITLNNKENALFQAVNKDAFLVNSWHHQAIKTLPPGKGEIIAMAGGNIIEAIEKKDAKGQLKVLTFQFHPESMETEDSAKIIQLMVEQARKFQRPNL